MDNFLACRTKYYQIAVFEETTHVILDLSSVTTNIRAYFYIIKGLIHFYPVIVLRDDFNVDLGIYIVGKSSIVAMFIEVFRATVKAIERPISKITRPSTRTNKRLSTMKDIGLIIESLEKPDIWNYSRIETEFIRLGKDYIKSISTLRIKKRFYGK